MIWGLIIGGCAILVGAISLFVYALDQEINRECSQMDTFGRKPGE